jgi:hypothetical protein
MAKEKAADADRPSTNKADERPPVNANPPAGMAPPPAPLAPEIEATAKDNRPPIDTNASPPGTIPDTVPGAGGFGSQPMRPDQTTQGQRPGVGGSDPAETHPDRPDIAGPGNIAEHAAAVRQQTDEEKSLDDARARAEGGSGNVYLVTGNLTTGHTGHVTETDLPKGADVAALIRLGALKPVGELRSDPRKARALGPEGMDEVDRMQGRLERVEDENDRLREENARLKSTRAKVESVQPKKESAAK